MTPISISEICNSLTNLRRATISTELREAISRTVSAITDAQRRLCFLPLPLGIYVQISSKIVYACRLPEAERSVFSQPIDKVKADACLVFMSEDWGRLSSPVPHLGTEDAFDIDVLNVYPARLADDVEAFHFMKPLGPALAELELLDPLLAPRLRALTALRESEDSELNGEEVEGLGPLAFAPTAPRELHFEAISPLDLPDRSLRGAGGNEPFSCVLLGNDLKIGPPRMFANPPR